MTTHTHVHFVGTIGLDSTEEVFDTVGKLLGEHVVRCPDGETGGRRQWVMWQYPFLRSSRYLELDFAGTRAGADVVRLKLATGVNAEDIHFGELGYAREARVSYQDFLAAKVRGSLPQKARFQVCLPTPYEILWPYLAPEAVTATEPAYEAAMLREIDRICAAIPHQDLAIQWDVCFEMLMWDGGFAPMPRFPGIEQVFAARFARICRNVPSEVQLGFHLCYGDNDAKHFIEPKDLSNAVGFANLILDNSGRRVDWIHMPVPIERDDEAYFAPLRQLKLREGWPEVFLGLVHAKDGIVGTKQRMAAAKQHLNQFGIATECGMARVRTTEQVMELLRVHAGAAE